jgi:hypothetical protein
MRRRVHPIAAVLDLFEIHKSDLVRQLRDAADAAWSASRREISANDIRHVLEAASYAGNASILVSAFPRSLWEPVGYVQTSSELGHARVIRTYRPRPAHPLAGLRPFQYDAL